MFPGQYSTWQSTLKHIQSCKVQWLLIQSTLTTTYLELVLVVAPCEKREDPIGQLTHCNKIMLLDVKVLPRTSFEEKVE